MNPEHMIKASRVAKLLGLSRGQFSRLWQDPRSGFPRPLKLSRYLIFWNVHDVREWMSAHQWTGPESRAWIRRPWAFRAGVHPVTGMPTGGA